MAQYKVTSDKRFRGHEPNAEFEADFTESQEERYVASGLIQRIGEGSKQPTASAGQNTAAKAEEEKQ